jgi:hypothetical protein
VAFASHANEIVNPDLMVEADSDAPEFTAQDSILRGQATPAFVSV